MLSSFETNKIVSASTTMCISN